MSETPYGVGYGRPPLHTRFQKGQSGNPGGKPKPKTPARQTFDGAIEEALNADKQVLDDARPRNVIEAFVRRVALDAVKGQASAQRLLLSFLDRHEFDAEQSPAAAPVFQSAEERTRDLLGDRYDEFKARFEKAVETGSGDELLALARECNETG